MGPAGGPPSPAPEAPDPRSIRDSLSKSGARTPDEDGMLEMVRLIDEDDDDEADAPKSATAFFKIPKSARKRPGGAPAGGAAPRIGGPAPVARVAGAPPPGGPPPIMGPNGPPPIGGPVAGGMISGPVAGGPMAISGPTAGGAAPFGDIDGPEPEPEIGRNRTRSFVTIAIVLLMLAFLGGSLLIAGGGVAYYVYTAEPESETPAEPNAERPEAPAQAVDTAIEEVEPLEVTEAKPQRQPRAKSSAPAAASPKPAASKPAATGGNLSVRLVSGDVTSVQLVCKGYTRRARFADGAASFKGVPMDTPCVLNLSSLGGPVARFAGAKAGNSYNCSVVSPEVASCN